jgi:hypothetical protein
LVFRLLFPSTATSSVLQSEGRACFLVARRIDESGCFGCQASHSDRLKKTIDRGESKARYGRRFTTVETVFGSVRLNQPLDRHAGNRGLSPVVAPHAVPPESNGRCLRGAEPG